MTIEPAAGQRYVDVIWSVEDTIAPLTWKVPDLGTTLTVRTDADIFDGTDEDQLARLFAVMALCPDFVFQVCTENPDRARDLLADTGFAGLVCGQTVWLEDQAPQRRYLVGNLGRWPLPNLHLGTTITDQAQADARIPALRATPALVRYAVLGDLASPVSLAAHLTGPWPLDAVVLTAAAAADAGVRRWARPIAHECAEADVTMYVDRATPIQPAGIPAVKPTAGRLLRLTASRGRRKNRGVPAPLMHDAVDVRLAEFAAEAELAPVAALLRAARDRGDLSDERLLALDSSDLVGLNDTFVGPVIDQISDHLNGRN